MCVCVCVCVYKEYLALNNLQWLICHKTHPTPNPYQCVQRKNFGLFENVISKMFVCFVLRHINLIGHLMPNQVKENKSEKKFKGEV